MNSWKSWAASVLLCDITSTGLFICWIRFAIVKVLPLPVTPSSVWNLSPFLMPFVNKEIAGTCEPLGWKSLFKLNFIFFLQNVLFSLIIISMKGAFVKILISTPRFLMNAGLKSSLSNENTFYILGELNDPESTINFSKKYHPEILILDPFFKNTDAEKIITDFLKINPRISIVLLIDKASEEDLISFIRLGIQAVITFDISREKLISTIKQVVAGETLITEILATKLLKKVISKESSYIQSLSAREMEVLNLISMGQSNREIGKNLFISERTVKNHLSSIFKKIDVKDRTQAAIFILKYMKKWENQMNRQVFIRYGKVR